MTNIADYITLFEPISLVEMENVSLLNRTDTKFYFNISKLPAILNSIKDEYKILTFDKNALISYNTLYYDTPDRFMYYQHHRGKANRVKVRTRIYGNSGIQYFEVKFKDNKGRTIKERMKNTSQILNSECDEFVGSLTGIQLSDLQPVLKVEFQRMTLVHKTKPSRITIDSGLHYNDIQMNREFSLENIIIMEVKQDKFLRSDIEKKLLEFNISRDGFSKYCIGLCLLNDSVRKNRFKARLLKLKKLQHKT